MLGMISHKISAQNTIEKTERTELSYQGPLDSILFFLEHHYDVGFIYESKIVQGKIGQIRVENTQTWFGALAKLLSPWDMECVKISNDTYAIRKIAAQESVELVITGHVLSRKSGERLPGVNIRTKQARAGTVTDINGNFSIALKKIEHEVLIFTYVGYRKKEITLKASQYLTIAMDVDETHLSEVVVTATGQDRDKRKLGYAVQNVAVDEILRSHENNLVSALSAKAAGVQVISSSGSPGASAAIMIRGRKSINSSNTPLFVLDGMPVSNTTSGNTTGGVDVSNRAIDINPYDIRKVTILKGPAATVLYGARAANGAIVIKTNRGAISKSNITFYSEVGFSRVNKLPPKQYTYAQGRPLAGIFVYRGPETGEPNSYGPPIDQLAFDGDTNYPYDKHGRLVPVGIGNGRPARAYNDYDAFWVTGHRIDHNVSISGGAETIKYYFSIGHLFQSGVVPAASFKRTSLKANVDFDITHHLKAGFSSSFVSSGGERIRRGSNISGVTVGLYRNTPTFDIGNGKKGKSAMTDPATYQLPDGTQRAYRGNALYDNPFWVTTKIPYSDRVYRIMATTYLSYDITPWLNAYVKIGTDNFTDSRDFAWDIHSSSEPSGRVDQSTRTSRRVSTDIHLILDKAITENLSIHSTIGHNYYSQNFESQSSKGRKLSTSGFFDISNAVNTASYKSVSRSKLAGVFADVELVYRDYLFLYIAGRNDWSSRLSSKNNSFFYSAANVGLDWIKMLKDPLTFIDKAKMRLSYGRVGNAPIIYQTQDAYRNAIIDGDDILSPSEFPAYGVNAFERRGRKANQEVLPEFTDTFEIGSELNFFKQRIACDFSYYHAHTTNALVKLTLSAPSGYTSIVRNTGEIKNQGYEVTLNAKVLERPHFQWDVGINYTRNRSLVVALSPEIDQVNLASFSSLSSVNIEGHPYGVFSGTKYRRNQQGKLIIGTDGFPLIDAQQGPIGDPNPDWMSGITHRVRFRNVTFSMLWDIKYGGDVWNGTKGVMSYLGVSKQSGDLREVKNYIYEGVLENGEPNTTPVDFADPALGLSGIVWRKGGFSGVAEDYIEDGSWMRMREMSLSYSLPKKWIQALKAFRNIEVSCYGRNLWLITSYEGIDPETNLRGPSNAQGWDYFNLPNTKSIGFVLTANIN